MHWYKGFLILKCWRSGEKRWHIYLKDTDGQLIHVGPEDLDSQQDAEDHIDAMCDAMCDGLEADAFGEYAPCGPQ